MTSVQGKRHDMEHEDWTLKPGEYGKSASGKWFCCAPTDNRLQGNLGSHEVTEHEDGTITASPSILITHHTGAAWHGYLEHGVWRQV